VLIAWSGHLVDAVIGLASQPAQHQPQGVPQTHTCGQSIQIPWIQHKLHYANRQPA
jgi:hypothetical protein